MIDELRASQNIIKSIAYRLKTITFAHDKERQLYNSKIISLSGAS